ncbi:MAG: NAD(P)/FAD-dependent oxidoreductase [bacterium]|nr:NAD(P)/FAD-dependent oxidoreductase [bacterium]
MANYDLVVIGAGPAGSMAAIAAAKSGIKTLLIEEHPEVGTPLNCGEGISKEWITKFVDMKPSWIASNIDGVTFTSPSRRQLTVYYPGVGYILERKIFDRDLAGLAAEAGAEVRVKTRAIGLTKNGIDTNKGKIDTKIIIGADGGLSRVSRWAGIDTKLEKKDFWTTCEYLLAAEVTENIVELIAGRETVPGGYIWIFPKSKYLANVGAGVCPAITKESPKTVLDNFLKWRFKKYSILSEAMSMVPSKGVKTLVKNNVCLVGDAGRLIDPISGGGIGNALLTGQLAGKAAADAIKKDDITRLKRYEKDWEKWEGRNFKIKLQARKIAMKLKDSDIELLFDFCKENFAGHNLTKMPNEIDVIKSILKFSPRFLKMGFNLLKS